MDHTDSSSNFLFLTYPVDFHPTLVMQKLQPLARLLQHFSSVLLSLRPPSKGCEGINLTTQCREWILFSCFFTSCCKFDHIAIVRLNPCCISSLLEPLSLLDLNSLADMLGFCFKGEGGQGSKIQVDPILQGFFSQIQWFWFRQKIPSTFRVIASYTQHKWLFLDLKMG